ncbi:MAG: tetratricopeptide repeat protein [Candidatus Omnitrophota bacterium]
MHCKKISLGIVIVCVLVIPRSVFSRVYETGQYLQEAEEQLPVDEASKGYISDGLVALERENYEKAKEAFWSAANLDPQSPDAYINLGIVAIKEADYESAIRLFLQAEGLTTSRYPKRELLYYNLGLACFMQYDYARAVDYLSMALEVYPDFGEAMYYLGRAYDALDRGQEALVTITKARNVFARKGQVTYAQKCGEILADLNSRYRGDTAVIAQDLANEGVKSFESGSDEQAISYLRESIILDPKNPTIYYQLGSIYAGKGAYYNAIDSYREAVKVAPKFTDAYVSLGEVYVKLGKYEEAIATLNSAYALDKKNSRCNYDLGVLYRELGRENTAESYFKEAHLIGDGKENYSLLKTHTVVTPQKAASEAAFAPGRKAVARSTRYPQETRPVARRPYAVSADKNKGVLRKGYFIPPPKPGSKGKRVNKFQKTVDY